MADYIITVYATILHTALKSTATAEGNFLHSAAVTRNFGHHLTTASRVKQKDVWRAPLKSRDPFLHLIFRRSFFFPKHFPVLIRSEKPLIRGRNYRTRNCRSGTNERKVSINGRSASLISSRNWRAFTRAKWRSRDNGEPVCRTSRTSFLLLQLYVKSLHANFTFSLTRVDVVMGYCKSKALSPIPCTKVF